MMAYLSEANNNKSNGPGHDYSQFRDLSINSNYSTLSTIPLGGTTTTSNGISNVGGVGESASSSSSLISSISSIHGRVPSATGPSISFLEEIKALGVNGTKRHLRPVNSNDSSNQISSSLINDNNINMYSKDGNNNNNNDNKNNNNTKSKQLLRRFATPFGVGGVNGTTNGKEAENKQRQHGKQNQFF